MLRFSLSLSTRIDLYFVFVSVQVQFEVLTYHHSFYKVPEQLPRVRNKKDSGVLYAEWTVGRAEDQKSKIEVGDLCVHGLIAEESKVEHEEFLAHHEQDVCVEE